MEKNMNIKDNQRKRITKMLLKGAMIDLMQTKPVEKITIKEICEKAQINRSTFYLHYSEPNELLKSIEDDIIENTAEYLDKIGADDNNSNAMQYMLMFFNYIKENDKIFRTLLVKRENPFFKKKFIKFALERVVSSLNCTADEKYEKYVYGFVVNGSLGAIIEWIESDYSLPEREIVELIFKLSKGTVSPFVK